MFSDKVEIEVKAGKGGDGRLGFRHEKYRAMGGPDGGDGGRGGSVIFEVDHNLNTLSRFKAKPQITADDGQAGGSNRKRGKSGLDKVVAVPPGTMIMEGEEVLADLTANSQSAVIAKGGRGGFGNAHFTASTRQAPRIAEKGEPGEARTLKLELKLVADVGLVGLPNAGKSTLLSVISNAKPEIGDYPFTTLIPNLGVVDFEDDTYLAADIPGLIEGASRGKGLGDEFLRHIERTAVLIHLIDIHSQDIAADYQTVQTELRDYQTDLSSKPQLIALTKVEGMPRAEVDKISKSLAKLTKTPIFEVSAAAHQGLDDLLRAAGGMVNTARNQRAIVEAAADEYVIDESTLTEPDAIVQLGPGKFKATGDRLEGFARRTDWDNPEAVQRLRDILHKTGLASQLRRLGAEPGDIIEVGSNELEWL